MAEHEISVSKAARMLGVTLHHVYALIWGGQLKAQKIGKQWRINVDAVERRLAGRTSDGRSRSSVPLRIPRRHDVVHRVIATAVLQNWFELGRSYSSYSGILLRRVNFSPRYFFEVVAPKNRANIRKWNKEPRNMNVYRPFGNWE